MDGHERHGGPLHRLGSGLRIAVVVLVPLEERLHVLSRDQPDIMAESLELAADVMRAGAGFHADQTGWNIGQAVGELSPGELDPQHDSAALILADEMEAVLAQIDADGGDRNRRGKP